MEYFEFVFETKPETQEAVSGWLSTIPFEAFQEEPGFVKAYIEKQQLNDTWLDQINSIASRFDLSWTHQLMPQVNWNAAWESEFHPILVDNFCGIRADFHPPFGDAVQYELVINPEMAFGTGHHSTTHLVIQFLQQVDVQGLRVFDYGCGTGVLGLLCSKMGAASIDGIDYDILSVENSQKNAEVNQVTWNRMEEATLDQFDGEAYDLVLANINRNVILDNLKTLSHKVVSGGRVLFSGFYEKDLVILEKALAENHFKILDQAVRQDWLCLVTERQP